MSRRRWMSASERVYAALMHVYPRAFRAQYGDEMMDYFRDRLRDERARAGARGVARLWTRALIDLASSAIHEYATPARSGRPASSGDTMLQALIYDLRFTGRMLRKNPVITAVAVIIIALGTGAVSTIFSVANAIVLRPLPAVSNGSQLAIVERTRPTGGSLSASYPYYKHIAANSRAMNLAAWSMVQLTMSTGGEGVAALGNIVSGNYFDVLGVRPAIGRFFAGDETRVHALVLSERFLEVGTQRRMRNQCAGARVVQQVGQLVALDQRVDRHHDGAALECGIQRDDRFDAVVEIGCDPIAAHYPALLEVRRELVGERVDLDVCPRDVVEHDRRLPGLALR